MSQRETIVNGKLFTDMCEDLPEERLQAKELVYEFNHTRPSDIDKRIKLMKEIFGSLGENCWVEPPINLYYGTNVFIGFNKILYNVHVPIEEYLQLLTASTSNEKHIAIIVSFEGRGIIIKDIANVLKENKTPIILISSTNENPLTKYANYQLYTGAI